MAAQATLHLLSGGAAQGLVGALQAGFLDSHGVNVSGGFGAVGAMKDRLLAGEPCDVLILTEALIAQLTASGHVVAGSARPLGGVKTGMAVKSGEALPDVKDPAALRAALRASRGVYFPDPVKATAGIHFMKVLKDLGIDGELADRLHAYPNGATAMGAMARADQSGLIGCTQMTEILYTPGVTWVAPLPSEYELATVYVAARCTQAQQASVADAFIALLSGPGARTARQQAGFEV